MCGANCTRKVRLNPCSAEIVPGDIAILVTGQSVPADIRLVESVDLASTEGVPYRCDAGLRLGVGGRRARVATGESEPVRKDAKWILSEEKAHAGGEKELTEKNMVYMGCNVQQGTGAGLVVATGMKT